MSTMIWNHNPLQVENSEWHKVEHAWDVQASNGFVNHSRDFMEEGSLHEFDVSSFDNQLRRMVHNDLELVVHERLEV